MHASAAMTLDIYADLFDSDFTAVADKLSETVGKMWARGVMPRSSKHENSALPALYVSTVRVPSVGFEPISRCWSQPRKQF
jgi:hypothetical protein